MSIEHLLGKVHNIDCLEFMRGLPDKCVDLVVTSPPYNKGFWSKNRNLNNGFKTKSRRIDYGVFDDKMLPEDYEAWQSDIIKESLRILKDTGSLFYNHTDVLNEHQTKHPTWVYNFPVKQIIIWDRAGTPRMDKSYFFPFTEYIFWIQKNPEARTFFERNNSIFKSNVWRLRADASNDHPAPFPIELPINCISACTPEGAIVFDPFMGSGTTAVASEKLKRSWFGCELNPDFIQASYKRIESERAQLKLF